MDAFTENILARARERQKMLEGYSDKSTASSSENIINEKPKNMTNKVNSEPSINANINRVAEVNIRESVSEGNIPKYVRQNSKTLISSQMPSSPQSQMKTLNIQRDNFNMEIKVTSSDNVSVEVEIAEQDDEDNDENSHEDVGSSGSDNEDMKNCLREETKNKLKKLGRLYSGEDVDMSPYRTEDKFHVETGTSNDGKDNSNVKMNKGKGLKGLAKLAETINQWEDDFTNSQEKTKVTPKKSTKPQAPKPPTQNVTSPSKPVKSKAPNPPAVVSPVKQNGHKAVEIIHMTPKAEKAEESIQWDDKVLKSLDQEQQVDKVGINKKLTEKTSKGINLFGRKNQENDQILKENYVPRKSPIKKAVIADKAAIFEGSPSSRNSKDPSSLSVSERKALFEKNKGDALIPKAAFAMAIPVTKKEQAVNKIEVKPASASSTKKPAPKPPVASPLKDSTPSSPVKAVVQQAGGIATTMAALLEKKNTISEQQIEDNIREQRMKEMDVLLNRFNKNKHSSVEEVDEDDEYSDETDETTAMLSSQKNVRVLFKQTPSAPPLSCLPETVVTIPDQSKSSGKRCSQSMSPKVAASLEDVKRIRVSPSKVGRLYPPLSDIEATTEEERSHSPTPNNSSLDESTCESDIVNTSFGRDVLRAVCSNQTPQKRPIYDESTASDISDVLDDQDDYLDEALAHDVNVRNLGPTPPKVVRPTPLSNNHSAQPSNSFHYKSYSPSQNAQTKFKSPVKIRTSPRKSSDLPTHVVDGDNVLPLTHTISFYRKQQSTPSHTPIKQISRTPLKEDDEDIEDGDNQNKNMVSTKIKTLQDEINKQQMVISQATQALNLCNSTLEFTGSTEQVEAEKLLLLATHRRQAMVNEIQRLKVEGTFRPQSKHAKDVPLEKGTLTISNIRLPLKREYVRALAAAGGKGHHVVCLIKCGEQVMSTGLVSTVASNPKNPDCDLFVQGSVILKNIYSDFAVTFEVYCLQAQEEILPHEVKYHISNKKGGNKMTPKKSKHDSRLARPVKESPGGPQAVRSPTFALMGYVVFSIQAVNKTHWTLNNTPSMSPLEGSVEMRVSCELAVSVEHRGFLTMFEDISGFGAWHRRWCLLKGHVLSYWKYPDDEKKMPPIDSINLKQCITQQVGPVSRDICARLHTLMIENERTSYPQDKETLVTVCKGDKTVLRHLLSADTKEERVEWCSKLNAALTALRMWGKSE